MTPRAPVAHNTVRPNKKETGIVSHFNDKREQFMVNDTYHFKVQLFFFLLMPFMTRKSHALMSKNNLNYECQNRVAQNK